MEGPRKIIYKERNPGFDVDTEEVLLDTKKHIEVLLSKLQSKIEAGSFQVVLGVDSSGRVPALIIGRAMRHRLPIDIRFIAGSRNIKVEDHESELEKLVLHFSSSKFKEKKVLIIDDIVDSASSLHLICKALTKAGVEYEIATLSLLKNPQFDDINDENEKQTRIEHTLSGALTYAHEDPPLIYGKNQMSGVSKGSSIFSAPLEKGKPRYISTIPSPGPIEPPKQNREVLSYTRKRVTEIAEELAQKMGWA